MTDSANILVSSIRSCVGQIKKANEAKSPSSWGSIEVAADKLLAAADTFDRRQIPAPAQPTRKYDLRAFARFLYEHCALDPDKAGDVAATILSEYDVRPDDCASQPSPAATVEVVRVPKVRTSHHRNKEEAARLQALVDQRYTRSSAGNAGLRAALQDIVTVIPSNQGGTQGAIRRTAVAALEQFPLTETEPQTSGETR